MMAEVFKWEISFSEDVKILKPSHAADREVK
jgi:hypothetical protein